ncbi:MAG TPA: hypothetical protein VD902_22025 [Symbiobacteriaceae bacterium]|nr:hypothetical protein [Symbiobacteriaceae bacterium]
MKIWSTLSTLAVPVLVAIYTWNYARWAARQSLVRGAAGLYLLAAACVAVPAFVYWWSA